MVTTASAGIEPFGRLVAQVLMPNDSTDLAQVEPKPRLYEESTNNRPRPFDRRFTKADLLECLAAKEAESIGRADTANAL